MSYKATVVERPPVRLSVCRAETFPGGIPAAWQRLEERVGSLRGRKFYGLTLPEEGQLVYYAGVESRDAEEVRALGFPTLTIEGGRFARVKLDDWPEHTAEIGPIFDYLMQTYLMQPDAPTIEFYRSQTELHLLIPLVAETTT